MIVSKQVGLGRCFIPRDQRSYGARTLVLVDIYLLDLFFYPRYMRGGMINLYLLWGM